MFLINKNIEFYPETYQLVNREKGRQTISLPVSASRCLLALLANKRLVTQQELFEFAWGEHHRAITPNNLYQNISILRKTLKIMDGNTSHWINTIPKKGFIFNINILVEEITSENIPQETVAEGIAISKIRFKKTGQFLIYLKNNQKKVFSLGCIIFAGLVFLLLNNLEPTMQLPDSFEFYKKIGACLVYINDDMQERKIHEKVLAKLKPDCHKFPYVYITAYSIMHSATTLACDKPINNSKPHCVSLLLRGIQES